jgi:hypothetical protein
MHSKSQHKSQESQHETDTKQPNSNTSRKAASQPVVLRKSTGPRTERGKERSKRNSIKYGIFSDIVVLRSESKIDFDALLSAFYEDRRPEGALEEVLVNKLVVLWWRLRRVWTAESAEIRAGVEFAQIRNRHFWDANERNRQDAAQLPQLSTGP